MPPVRRSRRCPSRFDPRVGRVIFVQPYSGVVLGRGVGVEPPIVDLHDGSVADSAAFVHANSMGARVAPPGRAVGRGPPGPGPSASPAATGVPLPGYCGKGTP